MTMTKPNEVRFVQHLCCSNDTNGNPRRIWATYDERGHIIDVKDEGYEGRPESLRNDLATELPSVEITPSEYREWLDREENFRGRFEVVEVADGFVWHRFYTRSRALKFRREHYKADGLEVREVAGS